MCGIVGYAGKSQAAPVLLEGLRSLEYRGYDSAGIAVLQPDGRVAVAKRPGRVSDLAADLDKAGLKGCVGIGHTRWATHGEVNEVNAHPHTSAGGDVVIVHNGIVENYVELRRELIDAGYPFRSATDSEVIAHLIARHMEDGAPLEEAVRRMAQRIRGAAAVVAASTREPEKLVGLRIGNAGGIVAGFANGANLLASDLLALLPHTTRVAYVESGEIAVMTPDSVRFLDLDGKPLTKKPAAAGRTFEAAQKGEYPHFMAKEIAEQPEAVRGAMRQRLDFEAGDVRFPGFPLSAEDLCRIDRILLIGMGTSLHAAMTGAHYLEALARIPAAAENSSELRYRNPVLDERTLVISITQSGETADTLAAMEAAAGKGARLLTLVEAEGTQATRLAEGTLPIRAGQEIGVAATKTLMNTLVVLAELALYLGAQRGTLSPDAQRAAVDELARLPGLLGQLLQLDGRFAALTDRVRSRDHLLYLGRGRMHPIAMEGALKMKEIAYIHAEGYAAGEMKHGVNALISDAMPTIALAPAGPLYEKMLSNVNEVKARGGEVIALVTEGDTAMSTVADEVLYLPEASELIMPMLTLLPLQMLAYRTAVALGHDPDKPRNLAKTVTVE